MNNIINEALEAAFEQHTRVEIEYKDELRIIEPHHLGVLGGVEQIHAYQTNGREGWRNFKLNEIQSIKVINEEFDMRGDYNSDGGNYTDIEEQLS